MKVNSKIFASSLFLGFALTGLLTHGKPPQIPALQPWAIFGEDNRKDVAVVDERWRLIARSVAGMVAKEKMQARGEFFQLVGQPLSRKECPGSPFDLQITVPHCTGFLAKPNLLITAAHCINSERDCTEQSWVFEYAVQDPAQAPAQYTLVERKRVYQCKRIVSRRYESFGALDYAIIELDRNVDDRAPLTLDFTGTPAIGTPVAAMGHPSGLPMKLVDGGTVIKLSDEDRMVDTDLDILEGNSGGPVFNALTGDVIGITSKGHSGHHHTPDGKCRALKICQPGDACHWSASSRVSNMKNEPSLQGLLK